MRILVTGASGWIGSASVTELIAAGHHVIGLARNDGAATRIKALGAEVTHGSLDDLDSLRAAAARAEGVVHLGYKHDFSQMADAARTDRAAIDNERNERRSLSVNSMPRPLVWPRSPSAFRGFRPTLPADHLD